MNTFIYFLLIFATAFIGLFIIFAEKSIWFKKILKYLTFAASGSIFAAFFHMVEHSYDEIVNPVYYALYTFTGFFAFYLIDKIFKGFHHHHGYDSETCTQHNTKSQPSTPFKLALGDGIHNIIDGIILASAFAINIKVGFAAFVGIFLHELVMQSSLFVLLKEFGLTNKKAIIYTLIAQSSVFIGFVLSSFVTPNFSEKYLIPIVAGAFVYIIVNDLLPHLLSIAKKHKTKILIFVISFVLGATLVFVLR